MKRLLRKTIKNMLPRTLLVQRLDRHASNCILLTFDDGPHHEITPAVLDRLESYGCKAIFFVVGRCIEKAPHILKLIQKKGHLVGNHSYIHSNKHQPWFLDYLRDIFHCQATIKRITGAIPKLFRPPKGQISLTTLIAPKLTGLKTVLWSIEGGEWGSLKSESEHKIAWKLIQNLAPRDIVLLHDDNPKVPAILDILLPVLQSRKMDLHSGIDFLP